MALTELQRDVCRLLAAGRRARGDSYIAGGVALSVALQTQRVSRDLDIFHDTTEAVARSWDSDRQTLEGAGYDLAVARERPGFVEAIVSRGTERVTMEWAADSAFRFFPLVEHDDLGLTLHPFDLATNKVLALVGRLEARDWVDVLECDARLQPLGYLAWAACGKDPGFTPSGIVAQALRSARYSDDEISALAFDGPPPEARVLSTRWHEAVGRAMAVIDRLPASHTGEAVLNTDGHLFTGGVTTLDVALGEHRVVFHKGRLGGALPRFK